MSDTERRFTAVPVEVRGSDASTWTIGGYAAKFAPARSENLGGFKEQIAPGAFNRSKSQGWPDVMARYNHDSNMLLGTTDAGTLRLSVDDTGLDYQVDVPKARADVYELVQRRDVRQSSFAFMTDEEDWTTDDTGFPLRTLIQVRLVDVAPVNMPAYRDTSVAIRSLASKFSADPEEVRELAKRGELVKFFKRTDGGKPAPKKRSAAAALARAMEFDPDLHL